MAWTSPRTWVAANMLTAAQLNTDLRDNLKALLPLDALAWTAYTPTLTQSGAVTKTINIARYTQNAKVVEVIVDLTATGAGTATNAISVSLPVTAANTPIVCGSGFFSDASAGLLYGGIAFLLSTTTMALVQIGGGLATVGGAGSSTTAAVANGDRVAFAVMYEAA